MYVLTVTRVSIIALLLAIFALLVGLFVYIQAAKRVDVLVRVADADTREPVMNAKVIVTAWSIGTNGSQPVAFIGETNSNGEAELSGKAPFVVRYVGCEAASPGKYAADDRLETDTCILRLRPLGPEQMRNGEPKQIFTYNHFTGHWAHGHVFISDSEKGD